jgi:HAMP domain-containing protein
MIDTLATFADQVTTVAREVGVEGKLGGQASVPGAAGTWKDLTDNVNQLAANLTTQVRAIADVATAVTKGDLTRSIQVDARGEVAELKDNINTMIDNLRLTTDRNTEQDWLKTNLAKFTNMLQGQRDLTTVGQLLLSELTTLVRWLEAGAPEGDRAKLPRPLVFPEGWRLGPPDHVPPQSTLPPTLVPPPAGGPSGPPEIIINVGGTLPANNSGDIVVNLPQTSTQAEEVQINFGDQNGSGGQLSIDVHPQKNGGEAVSINLSGGANRYQLILNLFQYPCRVQSHTCRTGACRKLALCSNAPRLRRNGS